MRSLFILILVLGFSVSGLAQSKKSSRKKLPPKIQVNKIEPENAILAPEAAVIEKESSYVTSEPEENIRSEKFSNFYMNTIPLVIGSVDAGWDFAFGNHFLVGPQIQLLNFKIADIEFSNSGAGLRAQYSFWPALTSGPMVRAGVGQTSVTAAYTTGGNRYNSKSTSIYYYLGASYSWFWDHFNLTAGASYGGNSLRDIKILDINQNLVTSTNVPVYPMVHLELGFTL